jgi:hypothetical protein
MPPDFIQDGRASFLVVSADAKIFDFPQILPAFYCPDLLLPAYLTIRIY